MKNLLIGLISISALSSVSALANPNCCHENGYVKLINESWSCDGLSGCGGRKTVSSLSRLIALYPAEMKEFESSCKMKLDLKLLKKLEKLDKDYDRNNGNGSDVRVPGLPECMDVTFVR